MEITTMELKFLGSFPWKKRIAILSDKTVSFLGPLFFKLHSLKIGKPILITQSPI